MYLKKLPELAYVLHYQAKVGLVCSTGGYVSNSILDNYDGISPATGY